MKCKTAVKSRGAVEWTAGFPNALIEACCLACVASIPLLCDPHGALAFQPLKSSFFRALAILCLAAFGLKAIFPDKGRQTEGSGLWVAMGNGLAAAGLFVVSTAISCIFSIVPWASWWGLAQFNEGFFTKSAWCVIFAGAVLVYKEPRQLDRLITLALAASLPVAIFAIYQRFGLDPGRYAINPNDNLYPVDCVPNSFGGNPIFNAGYLGMLVPLAVLKIRESFFERKGNAIERAAYILLAALQFSAIFVAQKRGPFLALILTAFFAVFIAGAIRRKFRILAVVVLSVAFFTGGLFVLGKLLQADSPITRLPMLAQLARIVPVGEGEGGDLYRKELWDLGHRVMTRQVDFKYPDGSPDPWREFRFALGYGTETVGALSPQARLIDRMGPAMNPESHYHNLLWDAWHAGGILGLVAIIWLVCCALVSVSGTLLLTQTTKERVTLAVCMLAGGVTGGLLLGAGYHQGFQALGFELGLVVGFGLGAGIIGFRRPGAEAGEIGFVWTIPFALMCAVVMHWLDSSFVFQTGNTSALFWVFAGVLCSPACRLAAPPIAEETEHSSFGIHAGVFAGLLSCLALIPMLYGLIDLRALEPFDTVTVLRASFLLVKNYTHSSLLLPLLILPSILGITFFAALAVRQGSRGLAPIYRVALPVTLFISAVFAWTKASGISSVGPFEKNGPGVLDQAVRLEMLPLFFVGIFLLLTVLIAVCMARRDWWKSRTRSLGTLAAGGVAALAVYGLVGVPIQAEILEGWGLALDGIGRSNLSVDVYKKAIGLVPGRNASRIEASNAELAVALAAKDPEEFSARMNKAAEVLLEGRPYSELDAGNFYLGRLLLIRILLNKTQDSKAEYIAHAHDALNRATAFAPLSEQAWFLKYLLEREVIKDEEGAAASLRRANSIVQGSAAWADFYAGLASSAPAASMRDAFARRAVFYFARAVQEAEEAMWMDGTVYRYHMVSGTLLRNLGDRDEAREEFSDATKTRINPWEANAMLATISLDGNDYESALRYADVALDQCPAQSKDDVAALKNKIILEKSLH